MLGKSNLISLCLQLGVQLDFTCFEALKLAYNRNKLFKTLHYWSRDTLNFDFSDKGLGIISAAHFLCMIFQQKCSSCYILLTDQISLPGCLYFLRYWAMCIAIACYPGFEINLIFLIQPFFLHDWKVMTNI